MHTRQTPRTIPDKPNYWTLTLGDKGAHGFRDPLPVYKGLIGGALTDADFAKIAAAAKDGRITTSTVDVWAITGAVIGLCWYDATRDLDAGSIRDHGGDLMAYGEAVLYELQDEGYTDADVGPVLSAFLKRALPVDELAKEAMARADFSVEEKAASS